VNTIRIKNIRKLRKADRYKALDRVREKSAKSELYKVDLTAGASVSVNRNLTKIKGLRSFVEAIDERKWETSFNESLDVLEQLAEEAGEDFKQGKTKPLPF
jgi:hypothetical protein